MTSFALLAQRSVGPYPFVAAMCVALALLLLGTLIFVAKRYKRCPSNRVLVIYGKVGGGNTSQLHPRRRRVRLAADPGLRLPEPGADPDRDPAQGRAVDREHPRQRAQRLHRGHRHRAGGDAERRHPPAGPEHRRRSSKQAEDIIFGQLRQVIASMRIEDINRDRETVPAQHPDARWSRS